MLKTRLSLVFSVHVGHTPIKAQRQWRDGKEPRTYQTAIERAHRKRPLWRR